MKYPKLVFFGLSLSLTLALSACQAPSREPNPSRQSTAPVEQITAPVEQTTATLPASQFWDDVVELMNPAGDTTTVYKLEDGRYLDRMDRFFTYDGVENWTCDDGSIWHRKPDATAATTNVYAEFAVDRLLAQRPDHFFFSDAAGNENASKVVLSFDTTITNFRFLQLEGNIDETGEFLCTNMQELYSRDEITENDLMVVETVLEGLVPNRGIRFVDAGGNTRYYYLTVSGEDNVPLLIPFQ
ncbi:MAG: hypothetical protein SOX71_02820 [Candidatus Faecousia sp.]|nr:hypothetical protein [Candidatus Faecousia sp.]